MYDFKSEHISKEAKAHIMGCAQRMRPQFLREVFHIPVEELPQASTRDNLRAVNQGRDLLVGYRTLSDDQIFQAFCQEISNDEFGFSSLSEIKCREAAKKLEMRLLNDPEWFLENLWHAFLSAAETDYHYAYDKNYD